MLDPRPGERCSTTDPTCQFSDQFRVQREGLPLSLGDPARGVSEEVSGTLSRTITALVGTPFEVAFGFNLQGGLDFTVDATSTGVIDWDLPTGTTLTSLLGWTDPDALIVAVPTPGTLPLLLFGLSALAAASHRRKRTAG